MNIRGYLPHTRPPYTRSSYSRTPCTRPLCTHKKLIIHLYYLLKKIEKEPKNSNYILMLFQKLPLSPNKQICMLKTIKAENYPAHFSQQFFFSFLILFQLVYDL